ncbi:LAGLIDADG family homing endonuclease [Parahaliea mediterranea]|uniref:LAGLIDADG family homing endonuclease n=1 Tax=Parahaliea mediterranea TaxID=651086 RepID=A0A939IH92_9GAMM|nr:LAGLIDADG family homing endonuclease [Parahaliea mediterranea]MBN7795089.1 LAGLIDADG family homing endonuclease [Parahaliea mediterranea]
MTTYKRAQTLSDTEAAYIAGLVDGEGTITLTRKHRNENRQLALTISSTERGMLDFVLARTGVGKITNKRRSKAHHQDSFAYAVYNRQALQLIRQIGPYLLSYKSARCALILSEYIKLTPRNGKYSPSVKAARERFETSLLAIKPATHI